MKKLFPESLSHFPSFARTTRTKAYAYSLLVLLAGCTNTQVRWDATMMRKDVMVYYDDQIMENLIKARKQLPFVHVDIQTLTSAGASQVSGTIGYGETTTNTGTRQLTNQTVTTDTSGSSAMTAISTGPSGTTTTAGTSVMHMVAGTVGVVGSLAHAAMRPFGYSVSPLRSETLTIVAAPALGSQAQASPTPAESPTPKPTATPMQVTKETTAKTPVGTTITTERTPSSQPSITIYQLYEDFARGYLSQGPKPEDGSYVPGTLKRWGNEYYYIKNKDRAAYYKFCKALFTKGQAGGGLSETGSLDRKINEVKARVESQNAAPLALPPTIPP